MGKLITPKFYENSEGYLSFYCPGCKDTHTVKIPSPVHNSNRTWLIEINNNQEVSLMPSVLVTTGHYVNGFNKEKDTCWCEYNKENPNDHVKYKCGICHSFVTNNKIRFLTDSTHELAGTEVEVPDWPYKV